MAAVTHPVPKLIKFYTLEQCGPLMDNAIVSQLSVTPAFPSDPNVLFG